MRFVNVKVPDNIIRDIKAIEKDESDIAKILETGVHQIRIEHALSRFKRGGYFHMERCEDSWHTFKGNDSPGICLQHKTGI